MSPINLEIKNKIAIATMDYPPVNALSADANNEIIKLFDSFHTNKDVNVVILTAAGSRAFCAGVDLNSRLPSGNSQNDPSAHYRRARETFNSIYECAVPVIGAINGPALGAGLAIAASCDFLIASDNANFGLPEIDVGLLGGAGHLQRLFPQSVTRMMNFTAKRMPAEEAKSYGAVIEVVTLDNLLSTASLKIESLNRFCNVRIERVGEPLGPLAGHGIELRWEEDVSGHGVLTAVIVKCFSGCRCDGSDVITGVIV